MVIVDEFNPYRCPICGEPLLTPNQEKEHSDKHYTDLRDFYNRGTTN